MPTSVFHSKFWNGPKPRVLTKVKGCTILRNMKTRVSKPNSSKNSIRNLLTVDGKALTDARLAARVSQEQVAQRIGINKAKLSRWEQSQLMPSLEHIDALVAVLGTYSFVRLNGKAVLTAEEIEAVRKLREG